MLYCDMAIERCCPTSRSIAFFSSCRSAVNGVDGAAWPIPTTATRSEGCSRR